MKGNKKIISIILASIMVIALFTGCTAGAKNETTAPGTSSTSSAAGSETDSNIPGYLNPVGYPIVKEPITLTAMVMKTGSHANYEYGALPVFTEYEKMTGVKIVFDEVLNTAIVEKRNLAFASGEIPDLFYRANLPSADYFKYGEQGLLIELNELIDKYAPNLKAALDLMPEVSSGIKSAEGNIYALPTITDSLSIRTSRKLYINTKFMQNVGGKMPGTTDELYELLKLFRDMDANGNGQVDDEVPISGMNYWWVIDCFKGAFGLGNRGFQYTTLDMDEKSGKIRFQPATEEYKEFLQYCNKLYSEGLIDKDIFTMDGPKLLAKGEANTVGAVGAGYNEVVGTVSEAYEGIPAALKGPKGDQLWPNFRPGLFGVGSFAITKKCKYPEAAMRWIDYFYGDEGMKHLYMGKEGETFRVDASGKYNYIEEYLLKDQPADTTVSKILPKFFAWPGGYMPTIISDKYFNANETKPLNAKAAEYMKPYLPTEIWSAFTFTTQELEKLQALEADINGYYNQMIPQFIAGKTPFSEWDLYVGKYKSMGLDEYLSIYQAALERQK